MGLPVEHLKEKERAVPVADYLDDEWREWLQTNRIELDAMEPSAFLCWLDEKMEAYEGKLVPPEAVLCERLSCQVKEDIRQKLTAKAIQTARVDEQTEAAFSSLKPDLEVWDEELSERVEEQLEDSPKTHWTKPVDQLASDVVDEHYGGAD
jgi:hypothetical protein